MHIIKLNFKISVTKKKSTHPFFFFLRNHCWWASTAPEDSYYVRKFNASMLGSLGPQKTD